MFTERYFKCKFNLFIPISSSVSFGILCISRNLSSFIQILKLTDAKFFIIFLYCSIISQMSSDVTCLIPDIKDLSSLFFPDHSG